MDSEIAIEFGLGQIDVPNRLLALALGELSQYEPRHHPRKIIVTIQQTMTTTVITILNV